MQIVAGERVQRSKRLVRLRTDRGLCRGGFQTRPYGDQGKRDLTAYVPVRAEQSSFEGSARRAETILIS